MSTIELQAYEILKTRFDEQEASVLIECFEAKADQKLLDKKDLFASKADVAEAKVEIIKWLFLFWIGQMAAFSDC